MFTELKGLENSNHPINTSEWLRELQLYRSRNWTAIMGRRNQIRKRMEEAAQQKTFHSYLERWDYLVHYLYYVGIDMQKNTIQYLDYVNRIYQYKYDLLQRRRAQVNRDIEIYLLRPLPVEWTQTVYKHLRVQDDLLRYNMWGVTLNRTFELHQQTTRWVHTFTSNIEAAQKQQPCPPSDPNKQADHS